jgi:hypothetical protein
MPAAAAAAKVKKPGVLSQSASFPARGPAGGAKKAAVAAAVAVATTPKQAKAAALANGSEVASGWFLFPPHLDSYGVRRVLTGLSGWVDPWQGGRPRRRRIRRGLLLSLAR